MRNGRQVHASSVAGRYSGWGFTLQSPIQRQIAVEIKQYTLYRLFLAFKTVRSNTVLSLTQNFSRSVMLTFNIHFSIVMMCLYMWVTEPHVVIKLWCGRQVAGSSAWHSYVPSVHHNIGTLRYHLEQTGGHLCHLTFLYALSTSQYRYIVISPWTDRWLSLSPTCL